MKISPQPVIDLKQNGKSTDTVKEKKLRSTCADFEALLLKQFLTMARKSVPKGGILDGGYAEEMFRSMQDDELAKNLARNKGVGFGDMLYRELTKTIKQPDRG